jgi:hypothetical protein
MLTESWNGTSWTEITEVNVARFAAVMTGSQTEAITAGGSYRNCNSNYRILERHKLDTTSINTARSYGGGAGSSNIDGIIFGGDHLL